ncbi:hypothetical protein OYC64_011723 [Pagothenia borchgrevinki]|uniref:Uncharacterized protein n=1 Tax=Pagothenia borchgrevinki TaxID=8213 RepID=A0ABD2FGG6_PAGBO
MLATHEATLDMMQLKLADMEDRSRRCNVRITGLAEGVEGSNAIQFLTHSLPKWFPSLTCYALSARPYNWASRRS